MDAPAKGYGSRSHYRPARFVYFIQAQTLGLIKIGCAVEVTERLCTLQIGSPDQLKLLAVIETDGARGCENALHHRFAKQRSHGEWFHPTPELLAYIAEHAEDYDEKLTRENFDKLNAVLPRGVIPTP